MKNCLRALCVPVLLGSAMAEPMAPLTIDLGGDVRLEMVLVPHGAFRQGSPPEEVGRNEDETLRAVTIGAELYLGKFPVTRRQFARFVQETGYSTEAEKGTSGGFGFDGKELVQRKEFTWRNPGFAQTEDHPVVLVTYDDALAFTDWASRKAGRKLVLPTEAQWEYACRAGTYTAYSSGGDQQAAEAVGWYKQNAVDGTRPVGQKHPNVWGLYDMSGNAYEWCRDWFAPYEPGPLTDPEQARSDLSDKPRRVLRGGSWFKEAKNGRCAARYRNTPGSRNPDNGFRVATAAAVSTGAAPDLPAEADGSRAAASSAPTAAPAGASDSSGGSSYVWPPSQPWYFRLFNSLFPVLFGGMFLFAILFIGRNMLTLFKDARQVAKAPNAARLSVRLGDDGFWIDVPESLRGRSAKLRCTRASGSFTEFIRLEPGPNGQFIYTGGTPSDVLVEVLSPAPSSPLGGQQSLVKKPDRKPEPPRPFRDYPSAY